ncbi:uncharacterized protein LOC144630812 [Oculina patagonica]
MDVIAVGERWPQINEGIETERSNENINTTGAGQNMVLAEVAHQDNRLDVIALEERRPHMNERMETGRSNGNINTITTGHRGAGQNMNLADVAQHDDGLYLIAVGENGPQMVSTIFIHYPPMT